MSTDRSISMDRIIPGIPTPHYNTLNATAYDVYSRGVLIGIPYSNMIRHMRKHIAVKIESPFIF